MPFSREVLSPPSRPGSFAPSPGSSPNAKGGTLGGEKKLGRGSLDEGLLEAFVYDEEPTRSSEPSSSAGAPLKPRRAVGSSLFGEASASWRRSAQHSAHHTPSGSPGSGGHKAEELGGELQLEALLSQGEPLGFLSEDEEEPLDLLEPPKPQGKQGRALPMDDDDLFGGTDDGGIRLDDDEVPFSDDLYPPSKPNTPKPAALKPSRAQAQSLFDFSDEGYSLDPHDELSLPSEDALDLDAPIPPPRGASARAKGAHSPARLGLEEPEDRFGGEEDIYDLDLPSELPPKGTPKAPPPKGRALDDSLGDSLGAISDLPPVKTEREEHDVSRIYQ
jgi:hypothetical protein